MPYPTSSDDFPDAPIDAELNDLAEMPPEAAEEAPTPNAEQQAFLDLLLREDAPPLLCLTGEGGAGKTWTLAQAAKLLHADGRQMIFISPTHQAKGVLELELETALEEERKNGMALNVTTVAAFLKKGPDQSRDPGEPFNTHFTEGSAGDADQVEPRSVVCVDEISMVSFPDIKAIARINAEGTTVLSGDEAQLPPVKGESLWSGMRKSIAAGRAAHVHLKQNMRAKNDGLKTFINAVRDGRLPAPPDGAPVTIYASAEDWYEAMVRESKAAQENGQEGDAVLALAYRNATVDRMAKRLRTAMGLPLATVCEGEVLRTDVPAVVLDWHEEYRRLRYEVGMDQETAYKQASENVKKLRLQTGNLFRVLRTQAPRIWNLPGMQSEFHHQRILADVLTGPLAGKHLHLDLVQLDESDVDQAFGRTVEELRRAVKDITDNDFNPRTPAGQAYLAVAPDTNKRQGLFWKKAFYDWRDHFVRASMATCLTVHKAQGTGRDHVFINWPDLAGGDAKELRYTAVSRARRHLHILKG